MAISTALQDRATARTRRLVPTIGLCLMALTGCSSAATNAPPAGQSPPQQTAPTAAPSEVATQDSRPEVPAEVVNVSRLLVEAAISYDACPTCSDLGFLVSAEALTTHEEFMRLERSQRAHLPWAAMQSRHERSHLEITDIHAQPSKAGTWSVVVSGTREIRTTSARSRSFVQVHLTVIRQRHRWLVAQARGAGL